MRILVIGASGFVGLAAAQLLSDIGHEVIRAVGPLRESREGTFPLDVSNYDSFPKVGKLDAIVNCAGIAHRFGSVSADEFDKVHVKGARNAAKFSIESGARTLVQISSVLVYGNQNSAQPVDEQFEAWPGDDYARSKLEGELAASEVCQDSDVRLVILRPAPVIGEGSRGNVLRLIRAIDRGRFVWIGDGSNRRSLIYVRDVARAVATSLDITEANSVYNVVGETATMKEIVSIIAARLGKNIPTVAVPRQIAQAAKVGMTAAGSVVNGIDQYRRILDSWLADAVFSGEAFRNRCEFAAETNIEDGLRRQVDHFLANK